MQTKLLINGQLVNGEGPAQSVFNPSLGRVLVDIHEASEAQVDAAVRAAAAAFDSWSQTAPKDRSLLLLKLADAIEAHGPELAIQVSEQFVLGRIRPRKDHQRMEVATRYGISNKKLVHVIGEMEQHSEPPLSTLDLAESIKVTRRQLERLFRLHLNDTPSNFYLRLRLEKARQLLRQTDMSVLEVSIACGFESPSYFTRSYRARFERCPREDRRQSQKA